jgi:aminomethyltransferase
MVQIAPAFTKLGTELTIRDNGRDFTATVVRMPSMTRCV